jgi:hypothetical protein
MIKDLYFFLVNSQIWLNLHSDDCHFCCIFPMDDSHFGHKPKIPLKKNALVLSSLVYLVTRGVLFIVSVVTSLVRDDEDHP